MYKILVIEDNVEVNENLCEILMLANYQVFSANNGKQGVELANLNTPDLIICDVMMPELDGFGVLKILNQNEQTRNIPLIYLTAKSGKGDFRKGMGLGAVDYLTKPFDDVELLEAIEIRLEKSAFNRNRPVSGIVGFYSVAKAKEQLKELILDCEIRKFGSRDIITEKGTRPRFLYYILDGVVRTFVSNEIGKELTLDIKGSSSILGISAAINAQPCIQNAMTLTDCSVKLIPIEQFGYFFKMHPDFASFTLHNATAEIERMSLKMLEVAYSSVRRKVALAILSYAEAIHSGAVQDGVIIEASREDLARIAGSAKESTIRTLSDFKSEGLIAIEHNQIILVQVEKLKAMPL